MTKKPIYVSPDRFALLATDDNNDVATTTPLTNLKDNPMNLFHTKRDMRPLSLPTTSKIFQTTPLSIRYYLSISELRYSVKHIYNVKNKNKCSLPLFFIDILTQDNKKDVLEIKFLLNTNVSIEKPHKKKRGPPQCHNCQSYECTRNICHHEPKSISCDYKHPTNKCSKDRQGPAKFTLCNEEYIANYKG
jgi:hypothetical protein